MKKIILTLSLVFSISMFSNNSIENNTLVKTTTSENLNYTTVDSYQDSFYFVRCYANVYYEGRLVATFNSWNFTEESCLRDVGAMADKYIREQMEKDADE